MNKHLWQNWLLALKWAFSFGKNPRPEKAAQAEKDARIRRLPRGSLSAKSITITDVLGNDSTEYPYTRRMSGCTALIDGHSYKFELTLQYGSLDADGYKERPCWSWINVTGPSNDNPKRIVKAMISREFPFKWLPVEQPLHPIAVKQGIRQWLESKATTQARMKCNRVEHEFQDLCVKNGQARKRARLENAKTGN
ncbi:MAG: hypothetical protein WA426_10960 [Silvibacterium sp.]